MSVSQAIAAAMALGLARLDAQLLLLYVLDKAPAERAWLLAHDGDILNPQVCARYVGLCSRRTAGEPLAYISGCKEFYGLDLRVDSRVLVPRPDTETLVDWALEVMRGRTEPRVIDLGTGSGAIALAIKSIRSDAQVEAVDASDAALAVADANAARLGLPLTTRKGSWFEGSCGPYDLIVSNPPYIAAGDPHLAALTDEPLSALVSGTDGLDDIRAIVSQAPIFLKPGGWLLLEHGHDQAVPVRALLSAAGFGQVASRRDIAGIERCSGAKWLELG